MNQRSPATDAGDGLASAEQVREAAATKATPPVNIGDRWVESWRGSGMMRGSSIWTTDSIGCHKHMIEHLGGDEATHASVRRIVAAHNAALPKPPVQS